MKSLVIDKKPLKSLVAVEEKKRRKKAFFFGIRKDNDERSRMTNRSTNVTNKAYMMFSDV